MYSCLLSIHPFSTAYLVRGASILSKVDQMSPLPRPPAFAGGSQDVPRPDELYSGSVASSTSSWMCLEYLPKETSRRHPNQTSKEHRFY